jgi:hypothetical protein
MKTATCAPRGCATAISMSRPSSSVPDGASSSSCYATTHCSIVSWPRSRGSNRFPFRSADASHTPLKSRPRRRACPGIADCLHMTPLSAIERLLVIELARRTPDSQSAINRDSFPTLPRDSSS